MAPGILLHQRGLDDLLDGPLSPATVISGWDLDDLGQLDRPDIRRQPIGEQSPHR